MWISQSLLEFLYLNSIILFCNTKKCIDNRISENILKLVALQTFQMMPKNHLFMLFFLNCDSVSYYSRWFWLPPQQPSIFPSSSSLLTQF